MGTRRGGRVGAAAAATVEVEAAGPELERNGGEDRVEIRVERAQAVGGVVTDRRDGQAQRIGGAGRDICDPHLPRQRAADAAAAAFDGEEPIGGRAAGEGGHDVRQRHVVQELGRQHRVGRVGVEIDEDQVEAVQAHQVAGAVAQFLVVQNFGHQTSPLSEMSCSKRSRFVSGEPASW